MTTNRRRSATNRRNGAAAPAAETKRCAIYTRKSTAMGLEQEFNSLDAQRDACERYVAARAHDGWKLVTECYDDGGFTGANIERPGFQKLLADADASQIDVVVVYKVDRLSRSLLDFAKVMDRFNKAGVAFVSVTQNFSTADAMGRLTLNMLMSFAEFEREMIAERTRDKIAAARRRGKWTGGRVPLGYDVVDKKLIVNDLEAVVVRELFSLYEEHRSALTVSKILNESGRTTKHHRAKNGNVSAGKKWSKAAVLRVLKNPVYAGNIPCGDELHEGEHDALIERERYRRLRAILDTRGGTNRQPSRNPEYMLRGILRCAHCESPMTTASTRKNGSTYRYYRCVKRDKEGAEACIARPLPADAVERFVVERIREATTGGTLAADVEKRLRARIDERRGELTTERNKLPAKIAKLSAEGRRLVEKIGEAKGPASGLLDERIAEVTAQLGTCEARLGEAERALALLRQSEIDAEWVVRALGDFDAVWDVLSVHNRARLVRALVRRVEINETTGEATAILTELEIGDLGEDAPPDGPPTTTTANPPMEATA